MSGAALNSRDRRVQFDVHPDRVAELDQLMVFCDLRTRKDLFDNAMTLFEWAVDEVRKGNQIASYDRGSDHVEIVRLPVLENAARKAQSFRMVELVDTSRAVQGERQPQHGLRAARRIALTSESGD